MAVVGNFYFSIFLRLTWKFLGLESERGGSFYWSNNKIIDKQFQRWKRETQIYTSSCGTKDRTRMLIQNYTISALLSDHTENLWLHGRKGMLLQNKIFSLDFKLLDKKRDHLNTNSASCARSCKTRQKVMTTFTLHQLINPCSARANQN